MVLLENMTLQQRRRLDEGLYRDRINGSRKNCGRTDYPSLYLFTKWGRCEDENIPNVIENRNTFPIEHDIEDVVYANVVIPSYVYKFIDCNHKYIDQDHLDHVEVYKNRNGDWVLINSPYVMPENNAGLFELGWTQIKPLYCENTPSYMKIVPRRRRHGPRIC